MQETTARPDKKVKWSQRYADLVWVFFGVLFAALVWVDNQYLGGGYTGRDLSAAVMTAALVGIGAGRTAFAVVFPQDRKRLVMRLFFGLYHALWIGLFMQLGFSESDIWASLVDFLFYGAIFGLLQALFLVPASDDQRALFEEQTIFDRNDPVARLGRIWPFATIAVYLGLMTVTRSPLVVGLVCASMLCFSPRIRRFRGAQSAQRRARLVEGARVITVMTLIAADIAVLVG